MEHLPYACLTYRRYHRCCRIRHDIGRRLIDTAQPRQDIRFPDDTHHQAVSLELKKSRLAHGNEKYLNFWLTANSIAEVVPAGANAKAVGTNGVDVKATTTGKTRAVDAPG